MFFGEIWMSRYGSNLLIPLIAAEQGMLMVTEGIYQEYISNSIDWLQVYFIIAPQLCCLYAKYKILKTRIISKINYNIPTRSVDAEDVLISSVGCGGFVCAVVHC